MVEIEKIMGRLGNKMFIFAMAYARARDLGVDYYFQDPKYFEKYADEIKQLFSEGIGETIDYVSIHVRRASNPINPQEPKYSENPFYVNLMETDYYQKVMALFPNEKFLLFSDDLEFCKRQEIFKDCEFSEGNEIEDFNKMATCKHNVLANSSYSYWSAYLNKNPDKKVIYPRQWYSDGAQRTVCPKDWICL